MYISFVFIKLSTDQLNTLIMGENDVGQIRDALIV